MPAPVNTDAVARVGVPGDRRLRIMTRSAVAALTIAFVAVGSLWAILSPAFRMPDEASHLSSIVRVAESGSWPAPGDARLPNSVLAAVEEAETGSARSTLAELADEYPRYSSDQLDQMTQHPPLYYWLGGAVYQTLGLADWRWDHALFALRLLGVLIVAPLPWLLASATRVVTRSPRTAVVAAAVPLAIPQLAHIAGSVNNDTLFILGSAVVAFLGSVVLVRKRPWWLVAALGVATGVTALTKGTALAVVPLAALAILCSITPAPGGVLRRIGQTAVAGVIAMATGLFWWAWNVIRYGTVQPDGLGRTRYEWPGDEAPDVWKYIDALWNSFPSTFWGRFGWLEHPISPPLVQILTAVCVFVMLAFAFTTSRDRRVSAVLLSQPLAVGIILLYGTWNGYLATNLFAGMQGRYWFGSILVFAVVSALAWRAMVPPRGWRGTATAIVIGSGVMAITGLVVGYTGFWEGSGAVLTPSGLADWLDAAALPGASIAVFAAIALVAVVGAVTLALFAIRRSSATEPAPPSPLETE